MKNKTAGRLWAVWGLAAAFVLLRVGLSPAGGQTPDSVHYLRMASQLLHGQPLVVTLPGLESPFNSLWPLGYPLSIATLGLLTRLPLPAAAVLLNLLLMATIAILLARRWQPQACVPALVLCLQYKIFSFIWSEGLFMLIGLAYCHALYAAFSTSAIGWGRALGLVALGFGLYFVRYVGFVAVLPPGLLGLFFFFQEKNNRKAAAFFAVSGSIGALIGGYFLLNYYLSGDAWGGQRFVYTEPMAAWLRLIGRGVANESLLIRDYDFSALDYAALAGAAVQLFVFYNIFMAYRGHRVPPERRVLLWFYAIGGLIQLLTPVLLRKFSPFDDLDMRLLGPATFFFLLAGLGYLATAPQRWKSVEKWVILLIVLNLLAGLLPRQWADVYGYTRYFFP